MAVHEPADHLLLTIDPLFSASTVTSRIKHTITLLDPAKGLLILSQHCQLLFDCLPASIMTSALS